MTSTTSLKSLKIMSAEGGRASKSAPSSPLLRRQQPRSGDEQGQISEPETGSGSTRRKYLEPPSIEVTPSSDEDTPWSNLSTPSTSLRLQRNLLKKWLKIQKGTKSEISTANNSPRSTPNSSPALRKRLLLTSKPFDPDTMVEKGSDSSSEKTSPPSMQQQSQLQPPPNNPLYYPLSGRNFIKNSKVPRVANDSPCVSQRPEQVCSNWVQHTSLHLAKAQIPKQKEYKMQSWYSMLSPTYKQRNEDFRKIFKKLPDTERLIVDYSCALQRDILLQGRLYISENWICFYSNIFRWETTISIQLKNIRCIKKEKTAKLIPNAIQVCTESDKHFFTSFGARDRSFLLIFRLWQNALLDKTLSPQELWHIVHQCYGSELGLTSEDEDYVSPGIQFNGLGNSEDIPDVIELMDTASHCGTDGKLDSCPLLDQASVNQSFGSLASSESLASFAEDSEEPMERAADASSSQTVTPLPEPCRPGLLLDSLPPLDLPNSEELPTDMSDDSTSSTTQDEGELSTFSSDLPGRLFINSTFHISADRLQQILFSKSQFIQDFLEQRKFTDLVLKPWSRESSTKQNRVISYTIPINNPLGPKTASVVETQILYKCSQKSSSCVVDSEVMTRGIPYQDYFYTAHRYYITSLAKGKSQLRVSSEIRYKKQPWNLVKALIEKNTWNGIEDYFHYLEEELSKAEKLWLEEPCGKEKLGFLSSLRRRKRTLSWKSQHGDAHTAIDMLEEEKGSRGLRISASASSHLSDHLSERGTVHSVSTVLLIISIVLVILVVLNMMLFYRLWSLEHTAHTFQTWQSYALSKGKFPQTSAEWAEILELQKRFHSVEVQKWKQILKASVELLDEMKSSLEKLQQGIVVTEPPLENEKRQG